MFQCTNTYAIEKLAQFQQAELEQKLRRDLMIHSGEEAEAKPQAEQANKARGWLQRWWNNRRLGTSLKK
ncbi:hypothetical protein [Paenibacillus sp. CF384]|uniref:hypothetical protein n=1 Tax=Paenibacillus sp. CF384 TaxID=1884382 RepID=UPI000899C16D|nr:hypothetical protein [Paenibacillus sp. CF384]SDW77971.1 hypothetical protein SAMN05518855_100573 [Paenibacillus sp. CF384]